MLMRILVEILIGVGIALLLRRFLFLLVWVRGNSMRETLRSGEILFALRRKLHPDLKRFDVVICRYPGRKQHFVKRIVALPNESIAVEEGILLINGSPVAEPFPLRKTTRNLAERQLDDHSYFVMGDNRPVSRDSRSVGPIQDEAIEAVVKCILWPLRRIQRI